MLTMVEKLELFDDALSGGDVSKDDLENLKKSYETSRDRVLGEDMFYETSFDKVYKCMRDADLACSDYIKALEYRVAYLDAIARDFATGVAQDNAELMRNLIRDYNEAQKGIEDIKMKAKSIVDLSGVSNNLN